MYVGSMWLQALGKQTDTETLNRNREAPSLLDCLLSLVYSGITHSAVRSPGSKL